MQRYAVILACSLGVLVGTAQATDDWVLKGEEGFALPRAVLSDAMQARGFEPTAVKGKEGQALLQELFMRESLLAQQDKIPAAQLQLLEKQVEDYRKGLLSRLALDALSEEGMPDFTPRAKELYEARKDSQYHLPLRLRVKVIQKRIGTDESGVRAVLEKVREQVLAKELTFDAAVQEFSEAEDRKLTQGDTFWFHSGQKVPAFFEQAEKLNDDKPLSEVFVYQDEAFLLQFIGRQEPEVQTYDKVKDPILAELKGEYQKQQRKLVLEGLRTRFQQTVEIHPDYQ